MTSRIPSSMASAAVATILLGACAGPAGALPLAEVPIVHLDEVAVTADGDRSVVEDDRSIVGAAPLMVHRHLYEGCPRDPELTSSLLGRDRIAPRKARGRHSMGHGSTGSGGSTGKSEWLDNEGHWDDIRRALRKHSGPAFDAFLVKLGASCQPLAGSLLEEACRAAEQDGGPYAAHFLRCTDAPRARVAPTPE